MKFFTFIVIALALMAFGLACATGFAWFAIEFVGGHDVSFREALGAGLLLLALKTTGEAAVG